MNVNNGFGLWRQRRNCRSIGRPYTTQHESVMGEVAVFCCGPSNGRRGVKVGDIGIVGKVEGGDGVPSLRCSQTQCGSHGGSRLPLVGGVLRCCDA